MNLRRSARNAAENLASSGRMRADAYGDGSREATVLAVHREFALGSILSSPVIAGGRIVFGSTDGYVYALG
jgi:outer membrane protein assembly factor BamB